MTAAGNYTNLWVSLTCFVVPVLSLPDVMFSGDTQEQLIRENLLFYVHPSHQAVICHPHLLPVSTSFYISYTLPASTDYTLNLEQSALTMMIHSSVHGPITRI